LRSPAVFMIQRGFNITNVFDLLLVFFVRVAWKKRVGGRWKVSYRIKDLTLDQRRAGKECDVDVTVCVIKQISGQTEMPATEGTVKLLKDNSPDPIYTRKPDADGFVRATFAEKLREHEPLTLKVTAVYTSVEGAVDSCYSRITLPPLGDRKDRKPTEDRQKNFHVDFLPTVQQKAENLFDVILHVVVTCEGKPVVGKCVSYFQAGHAIEMQEPELTAEDGSSCIEVPDFPAGEFERHIWFSARVRIDEHTTLLPAPKCITIPAITAKKEKKPEWRVIGHDLVLDGRFESVEANAHLFFLTAHLTRIEEREGERRDPAQPVRNHPVSFYLYGENEPMFIGITGPDGKAFWESEVFQASKFKKRVMFVAKTKVNDHNIISNVWIGWIPPRKEEKAEEEREIQLTVAEPLAGPSFLTFTANTAENGKMAKARIYIRSVQDSTLSARQTGVTDWQTGTRLEFDNEGQLVLQVRLAVLASGLAGDEVVFGIVGRTGKEIGPFYISGVNYLVHGGPDGESLNTNTAH